MNNQSIIRYSGMAAIMSALLYVASLGLWLGSGEANSPPLATAAYIASQLIFLITLYGLYLIHREEAATPTLVAMLLLLITVVASLFINPINANNFVLLFLTLGYGIGALLLGWLAYRSPRFIKGIGIAALLTGLLSLVMAPFLLIGASADLIGLLNLAVSIPYLVWLLWLGWFFLKSRNMSAQPAGVNS